MGVLDTYISSAEKAGKKAGFADEMKDAATGVALEKALSGNAANQVAGKIGESLGKNTGALGSFTRGIVRFAPVAIVAAIVTKLALKPFEQQAAAKEKVAKDELKKANIQLEHRFAPEINDRIKDQAREAFVPQSGRIAGTMLKELFTKGKILQVFTKGTGAWSEEEIKAIADEKVNRSFDVQEKEIKARRRVAGEVGVTLRSVRAEAEAAAKRTLPKEIILAEFDKRLEGEFKVQDDIVQRRWEAKYSFSPLERWGLQAEDKALDVLGLDSQLDQEQKEIRQELGIEGAKSRLAAAGARELRATLTREFIFEATPGEALRRSEARRSAQVLFSTAISRHKVGRFD